MKWKSFSCAWLFVTLRIIQSMEFSRPEYWSRQPFPSPGDFPNPGIKPRSPALQADSLPAEPPGKPKNTGVGSLSLLQWIFPTQGSNRGLLHCRRILFSCIAGAQFFTNWAIRNTHLRMWKRGSESLYTVRFSITFHGLCFVHHLVNFGYLFNVWF